MNLPDTPLSLSIYKRAAEIMTTGKFGCCRSILLAHRESDPDATGIWNVYIDEFCHLFRPWGEVTFNPYWMEEFPAGIPVKAGNHRKKQIRADRITALLLMHEIANS